MTADPVLEPPPPSDVELTPAPPDAVTTRLALHRLAEHVLSPAQAAVNGDIHFRWTPGGFGTPRFGGDRQLRVEGAAVVAVAGGEERRQAIGSLRDAARFVGLATAAIADDALTVDARASRWLGDMFGFGYSVLGEVAVEAPDAEPIRLWPEHFDIATDFGDDAAGARATYGLSPGDAEHDEPYVYVAPWAGPRGDAALWEATGFTGAELTLTDLLAADDPRTAALEFLRRRRAALNDRRTSPHA